MTSGNKCSRRNGTKTHRHTFCMRLKVDNGRLVKKAFRTTKLSYDKHMSQVCACESKRDGDRKRKYKNWTGLDWTACGCRRNCYAEICKSNWPIDLKTKQKRQIDYIHYKVLNGGN